MGEHTPDRDLFIHLGSCYPQVIARMPPDLILDLFLKNCHPEVSFNFVEFTIPPLLSLFVDCFKVLSHNVSTSIKQVWCHLLGEELKHKEGEAFLRIGPFIIRFF